MQIKELTNNPTLAGQVRLIENVTYAAADGEALHLSLLVPWLQRHRVAELAPRPLLVFVQGSSWQRPTLGEEIPQLVQMCIRALSLPRFNTATRWAIPSRPFARCQDGDPLLAGVRRVCNRPAPVVLWGRHQWNAALLAALTANDPAYRTADYPDQSGSKCSGLLCP